MTKIKRGVKELTKKEAHELFLSLLKKRNTSRNKGKFKRFLKDKRLKCAFCNKNYEVGKKLFNLIIKGFNIHGEIINGFHSCEECKRVSDAYRYNYNKFKMTESQLRILFEVFMKEFDSLERRLGKFIPIEELEISCINATKRLKEELRISPEKVRVALQILIAYGVFFIPRKGFIQRI